MILPQLEHQEAPEITGRTFDHSPVLFHPAVHCAFFDACDQEPANLTRNFVTISFDRQPGKNQHLLMDLSMDYSRLIQYFLEHLLMRERVVISIRSNS